MSRTVARDVDPGSTPERTKTGPRAAKSGGLELQSTVGNRALAAAGAGAPLSAPSRALLEQRFGRDFARVRVHTDAAAGAISDDLSAAAVTTGRDIFFAPGRYRPQTAGGASLLIHEAVHAAQQDFAERTSTMQDVDVSPARELEAAAATSTVLGGRNGHGLVRASGLQRQPAATATQSTTQTPGTAAPAAAPPVLVGFDMSRTPPIPYVSVTIPGHSLVEVATYLYGSPDGVERLRALNGALPEQLGPGRSLRFGWDGLTPATSTAINDAIRAGNVLRSVGMASEAAPGTRVYRLNVGGVPMDLTEEQAVDMIRGGARWLSLRVKFLQGDVEAGLETQRWHVEGTNSLVRGISDWMGDVDLPSESVWTRPIDEAKALVADIEGLQITVDSLPQVMAYLPRVEALMLHVAEAKARWHDYIEGTIHGAERTVRYLEITRNASFAVAAGLAGAVAAPAIFAMAGTGLAAVGVTGTAATVIAGTTAIGGAAVAGGTLRGGLEVAAPGAQADTPAWDRFKGGFKSGAVQGALGGAGALAAPGVAGVISQRAFGVAPQALTGGARIAVNVGTGVTLGAPSGAIGTGIDQLDELRSGRISFGEYMTRVGWGSAGGAAGGGVFSLLPISGLYRTGGMPFNPFSGAPETPAWMFAGPWGPRIQELPNAPAAFHQLAFERLPPLPENYSWTRIGGRWVTMRSFNVPEQPLQLVSYGPDPVGRFDYHLLSNGRLLGSNTTPRQPGNLFTAVQRRANPPMSTDDFEDPVTGTRYGRGHIHDHADTKQIPGALASTDDPLNYLPEARWWNEYIRNPLVNHQIRPAGNGYREMAFYDLVNPRFTQNGTPIPEGVFFVETNPAGQPVRAWRIPFNYNYAAGPRGIAALGQFQIPVNQLPPVLSGTPLSPVVGVGGGAAAETQR